MISMKISYFINIFVLGLTAFLIAACSATTKKVAADDISQSIKLKYATGFTINKANNYYLVKILTPYKGAKEPLTYVFYDKTNPPLKIPADAYIKTPISSIVCTSTTHIPLLEYLGETAALTGFPTLDYISSAKVRARIDADKVTELGMDEAINIEKLMELNPDVVMGYSLTGDFGQFNQIAEAGIPVVLNAEYLEQHPLGRAEWIKLAGILFDKIEKADSVFNVIEKQYLKIRKLVLETNTRPTVMSGIVYGDSWYLPGGKNYAAKILKEAGFTYLWAQDTSSAFLPLSFEAVYEQANQADYWIGIGSFDSREALAKTDSRYQEFRPFQLHKIYSYNKRIGAKGGSEYLELGYLRPDIILQDLVKIGHPNLLPDYELYFYFQLP